MTLAVFLVSPVGSQYDLGGVPGLTCREPAVGLVRQFGRTLAAVCSLPIAPLMVMDP
jgi:hypothetical protein